MFLMLALVGVAWQKVGGGDAGGLLVPPSGTVLSSSIAAPGGAMVASERDPGQKVFMRKEELASRPCPNCTRLGAGRLADTAGRGPFGFAARANITSGFRDVPIVVRIPRAGTVLSSSIAAPGGGMVPSERDPGENVCMRKEELASRPCQNCTRRGAGRLADPANRPA